MRPNLATQAERSGELKGGRICWYAEVVPRWAMPHQISKRTGAVPTLINMLPETSSDALWNHAREVDAAFVKTIDGARAHRPKSSKGSCSTAAWASRGCLLASTKRALEP